MDTLIVKTDFVQTNKNFKNIILNELRVNNILIQKRDFISYTYLEELSSYFVFKINDIEFLSQIESLKLFYLNEEDKPSIDLFINEDSFIIYKNQKFYYFQKITTLLEDNELKSYIKKKLNLEINNIYRLSKKSMDNYINKYKQKNKRSAFKNINYKRDYFPYFYIFYCLSILLFSLYFYELSLKKNDQKLSKYISTHSLKVKEKIKQVKFEPIEVLISNTIKEIKKQKLLLEHINLSKKSLKIVVKYKNKKNLYSFLEKYNKKIVSTNISKIDENISRCELNVRF